MKPKTETLDEIFPNLPTHGDTENRPDASRRGTQPILTEAQQQELLRLARTTITAYLQSGQIPKYETGDPMLTRCAGAFVTLWGRNSLSDHDPTHQLVLNIPPFPDQFPEKRLRGCIGHIWADTPLYLVVQEMAVAAATRDVRLAAVTIEELDEIRIEISILSPTQRLDDLQQIQLGRHGLLIVRGNRRGLLLPEVAIERGWDRKMFLKALCLKAGLPLDSWPGQATLYAFTTLKFGE